ncbi:MAG: lipopolysaccharide heptosyltransferase II [Candidatus Marinimicrobia bacterium]|nr:lipopolysaccharide heptosyltransferase II [Candidatus Neomarinimicrobiota bacterium]
MNVGIYAPNWIGDAVLAIPFVNRCRQYFPDAHITLIAKAWVAAIYQHHPSVDEIISLEGSQLRGLRPTTRSGRRLARLELDRFYILPDSLRTAYLSWLARSPVRIGFRGQFRSPFLTRALPSPAAALHRADRYLRLLETTSASASIPPGITVTKEEAQWAATEMDRRGLDRPLAVFPSSVAESRRVPLVKWVKFLTPHLEAGRQLLFIGSRQDRPASDNLIQRLGRTGAVATVCGETTLRQSIALMTQCEGAIASDSGLGHIAANLGLKTVSIFGAGDPDITRPLGSRAVVVAEPVHCSPCRRNICANREEPLLCLTAIDDLAIAKAYNAL